LNISVGGVVNVTGSGGNDITLTSSGDIVAGSINTGGGGDIYLTGAGIYDSDATDDNAANIITGGKVVLTASSGSIGTTGNELDVDAGNGAGALEATASSGNIYIQETSGAISFDNVSASGWWNRDSNAGSTDSIERDQPGIGYGWFGYQ
jgi:hypothetical protein